MAFINGSQNLTGTDSIEIDLTAGHGAAVIQVTGTWSGTISMEGTVDDDGAWFALAVTDFITAASTSSSSITANGAYICPVAGMQKIRASCTGLTGTAHVDIGATDAASIVHNIAKETTLADILDNQTNGTQIAAVPIYTIKVDEVSSTVTYIGKAVAGSSGASAIWQVSKMLVTGSVTEILFADGNTNFDNIWNNRASLSYS